MSEREKEENRGNLRMKGKGGRGETERMRKKKESSDRRGGRRCAHVSMSLCLSVWLCAVRGGGGRGDTKRVIRRGVARACASVGRVSKGRGTRLKSTRRFSFFFSLLSFFSSSLLSFPGAGNNAGQISLPASEAARRPPCHVQSSRQNRPPQANKDTRDRGQKEEQMGR